MHEEWKRQPMSDNRRSSVTTTDKAPFNPTFINQDVSTNNVFYYSFFYSHPFSIPGPFYFDDVTSVLTDNTAALV